MFWKNLYSGCIALCPICWLLMYDTLSRTPCQSLQTPLALRVLIDVFGSAGPRVPSPEIKYLCIS